LLVVFLTAIAFVGIVIVLAKAISPRSYNAQKFEPYECGIPTRGKTWMQFRVGYYLFAILFLMFDVETVLLFPWASIVRQTGVPMALAWCSLLFVILVLRTCHTHGGKEIWNGNNKETKNKEIFLTTSLSTTIRFRKL
jgi:NADH-quinone oxidoreductase subunit A